MTVLINYNPMWGGIHEYNKAVETYNQTNDATNTQRSKSLKLWNQKVDKFFEAHANWGFVNCGQAGR